MEDLFIIFSAEIGRLVDDYHKCEDENLKELIHNDIQLLSKALLECEQEK